MIGVTIMPAGAADLPGVMELEWMVAEAPHWTEAEYRAIVEESGAVRRCLLVARREDELAGFAVGKVVASEAELESVVVKASARRGGVGKALCGAVMAWGWEQGASTMELEVRGSSVGAIALYEGLGFVAVGRRRGYYLAPEDDALLMRLEW
jgi:[ribosomal protein S18]-alanine N-acetyltransferase